MAQFLGGRSLRTYPDAHNRLLERIFDEFGLIVCGWSGDWDEALRNAITRAPGRRYSTFWASRGKPSERAQDLIDHRSAKVVEIAGADGFFSEVAERVEALARSSQASPVTTDMLVARVKRYVARPEHRIELEDLIRSELETATAKIDAYEAVPKKDWTRPEAMRERALAFEAAMEPLVQMMGVLGRWDSKNDSNIAVDVIRKLGFHAKIDQQGPTAFNEFRLYSAVLAFTGYGLGLTRQKHWKDLYNFLTLQEKFRHYEERQALVSWLFLDEGPAGYPGTWNAINQRASRASLSDHIFPLFETWSASFVGSEPNFERLFDIFETLATFAVLQLTDQNGDWTVRATGRIYQNRQYMIELLQTPDFRTQLLDAGFAGGDEARFDDILDKFSCNTRYHTIRI